MDFPQIKQLSILNKQTLVLNKGWQAHDAVPVQDAISSVYTGRAKVMCPKNYPDPAYHYQLFIYDRWAELDPGNEFIRGTRDIKVRRPEIIIFDDLSKPPSRKVIFSRRNIWKRDGFRCVYCSKKLPANDMTWDHVIPKTQGGVSSWTNCVTACIKCNTKKGGRTPEQAGMPLIRLIGVKNGKPRFETYRKPKKPQWSPLYNLHKVTKLLDSWREFLQNKYDELYWNVSLLEE